MRMRSGLTALAGLVLTACAAGPGEIDNWPITGAEANAISGEVKDVLCAAGGDCPADCGGGARQLGIQTTEGFVLVAKNLTNYTGGADELIAHCGDVVDINGLFTTHQGVRFFQVQNVRTPGGPWKKAREFNAAWAERSGKPQSLAGRWYFNDDRVDAVLEKDGRLGLGPEADEEFFN